MGRRTPDAPIYQIENKQQAYVLLFGFFILSWMVLDLWFEYMEFFNGLAFLVMGVIAWRNIFRAWKYRDEQD